MLTLFFLFLWMLSLLLAPIANASVVINEFFPAPQSGAEWIELYNTDSETVDITDWYLEDTLSSPSILHSFESQQLAADELLVIELSSAKLNNSGDSITLYDGADQIIDTTTYTSSQSNLSWSRQTNGEFVLTQPSPDQANPQPSPSPTPSPSPASQAPDLNELIANAKANLRFNEIMSCPSSGQLEWLELLNSGSEPLSLDDWQIRDAGGSSRTFSTSLNSNSLAVVEWSGSLLNNTGDSISLVAPNGSVITSVTLLACSTTGVSFIFHDQAWRQTTTPTKQAPNAYTAADQGTNETDDNNADEKQDNQHDPETKPNASPQTVDVPATDKPLRIVGLKLPTLSSTATPSAITTPTVFLSTPPQLTKDTVTSAILGGALLGSSSWLATLRRITLSTNQHAHAPSSPNQTTT